MDQRNKDSLREIRNFVAFVICFLLACVFAAKNISDILTAASGK